MSADQRLALSLRVLLARHGIVWAAQFPRPLGAAGVCLANAGFLIVGLGYSFNERFASPRCLLADVKNKLISSLFKSLSFKATEIGVLR